MRILLDECVNAEIKKAFHSLVPKFHLGTQLLSAISWPIPSGWRGDQREMKFREEHKQAKSKSFRKWTRDKPLEFLGQAHGIYVSCSSSFMSKEYSCATERIVLSARTRFFGEATATIEAAGEREVLLSSRISKIVVDFRSGFLSKTRLDFPKKALEDLGAVYMNRWEFRDCQSARRPGKYLYLVGVAPHEKSKDEWVDKTFHFVIENGTLRRLSFAIPTGDDGSSIGEGFKYE